MKRILVLCAVLALSGCAQYDNTYAGHDHTVPLISGSIVTDGDRYDKEARALQERQLAGELTQLEFSKGLLALQQKYIPEETAYGMYLSNRQDAAQKLSDGTISNDQFAAINSHLKAAYQNELSRDQAMGSVQKQDQGNAADYYRAAMGAQIINNMNQNYQRGMRPLTPMVNCTSSSLGGVVSTSCY